MKLSRGYCCIIQYCPDLGRLEAANIGVLLFCPESPDPQLGKLQLVVLGKFGPKQPDSRSGVERILKEHHVRLFSTTEVDRLVDEIRKSAKDLP